MVSVSDSVVVDTHCPVVVTCGKPVEEDRGEPGGEDRLGAPRNPRGDGAD